MKVLHLFWSKKCKLLVTNGVDKVLIKSGGHQECTHFEKFPFEKLIGRIVV